MGGAAVVALVASPVASSPPRWGRDGGASPPPSDSEIRAAQIARSSASSRGDGHDSQAYQSASMVTKHDDMSFPGYYLTKYQAASRSDNRVLGRQTRAFQGEADTRELVLAQAGTRYCLDCVQVCMVTRTVPLLLAAQVFLLGAFADGRFVDYTAHAVLAPAYATVALLFLGFSLGYMSSCFNNTDTVWRQTRQAEEITSLMGTCGVFAASGSDDHEALSP